MNIPWRHHFTPQMLLRRFADADGSLFSFDKRHPERGIQYEPPKPIFFEEHLYSTVDYNTGELDPALEHFFDRQVENPASRVFEKVVTAVRAGRCPGLSLSEKQTLDRYTYYQIKRSPDFIEAHLAEYEAGLLRGVIEDENGVRPLSASERASIATPEKRADLVRNTRVDVQGSPSDRVFQAMAKRGVRISVIVDPKEAFVIGSNPVVLLALDGERLWFPIASDVVVSAYGPSGSEEVVRVSDPRNVRQLNELTMGQSNQIAGRSHALVASISGST